MDNITQTIANKIDIIIPAYKAMNKLRKTIYSYGIDIKYHFIIVIDGDGEDYSSLPIFFKDIQDIDIYYLDTNQGPGIARNYGIDKATREYITFIDAGDTIYNTTIFKNVINLIGENPNYYMISCAHYEANSGELSIVGPEHNRMHGKFFKRDFINKYNIRFSEECPRMNEDIGFNFAARAIAQSLAKKQNVDRLLHITDAIITWETDENSITRLNNYAFYYQKNNEGLARNAIYAIQLLQKNNIQVDYINDIIYQTLPSLYIFYYSCVFQRPEFQEEMENGTKIFFDFLRKNKFQINWTDITQYYTTQMRGVYQHPWDPFITGIPEQSFIQWYNFHIK